MKKNSWIEIFREYSRALNVIHRFSEKCELDFFEEQGLILAFEYTFDLACKTLEGFHEEYNSHKKVRGPWAVIVQSLKDGYIHGDKDWMLMLNDFTRDVDAYKKEVSEELTKTIISCYMPRFDELSIKLSSLAMIN